MQEKVQKLKLGKLVLDYSFYPRGDISPFHVREMIEFVKSGGEMPPIVADWKSKRIIDGFHRFRAYKKMYGVEAETAVRLKKYANEGEMLLDAMKCQSTHGRRLTPFDQARCIIKAEDLGLEFIAIASALGMTVERLTEIRVGKIASDSIEPVAVKTTMSHLAGTELTPQQAEFNRKAGGMPQGFYINQVIGLLESGSVDWGNEKVVNGLRQLLALLQQELTGTGAASLH